MPKRPEQKGKPGGGKQTNVRLSDRMLTDLQFIADTVDADLSHVIRTILAEHISEHLHRSREIRERQDNARKAVGDQ